LYADEKVKTACLRLQDHYGLNVNVLLYCLYLGAQKKYVPREKFERLTYTLSPWHENVTRPLRHLRRKIKTTTPNDLSIYNKLVDAEIDCERKEQNLVESTLGNGEIARVNDSPCLVTVQNLKYYCSSRGVTATSDDAELIEQLSMKACLY
jgi:uncharacterized protein (TIGR02444 family)